jgi:hypothetical protein
MEVAEVTEGGWAVAGCSLGDTGGFLARNTSQGESIAQRSRRSQRGMGSGRVFFGRYRRLLGEKYTLGGPGRVRLRPNRGFPCSFAGQIQPP